MFWETLITRLSIKRVAEIIHTISAFWVLLIAIIICIDVTGRLFFNSPLLGSIEIIKNSVVAITFMQLPLAIYTETMLKTTILYGQSGQRLQKAMRTLSSLLGFLLFLAIIYSSWGPFVEAVSIGEYEGEGALRVPTYPVRFLIVITSALAAFIYLYLIVLDWSGRLDDEGVPIETASPSISSTESHGG